MSRVAGATAAPQPSQGSAPAPQVGGGGGGGGAPRTYLAAGWLTLFVLGTDVFVISPLLPFVATRYHVDVSTAGWAVTAFSVAYMLAAPWLGGLSDQHGRRQVMVSGLIAFGIANLLTSIAPLATESIGVLLATRALAGVSAAAITPSVFAATGDVAPPSRRAT